MSGTWPIFKRELQAHAQSSSTYIVFGLLLLAIGMLYHEVLVTFSNDSALAQASGVFSSNAEPPNITTDVIQQVFRLLSAMILLTIPILTMRSIAQERSSGTFELLLTCPVGDWGILMGKYLALVCVGFVVVVASGIYPLATYFLGRAHQAIPELAVVLSCYLQLFLIFSTYAAFGLMASSFTQSQVVASIITLVGLLLWNVLGGLNIANPTANAIARELSPFHHTENFLLGLISVRDVVFYFLASFVCLLVASKSLESRRWRV